MTTVRIEECAFCGMKIVGYSSQFSNFICHVNLIHRNEPDVNRVWDLTGEVDSLTATFRKSVRYVKGKKIEALKEEGLI